jgi:hypothetical protein
LPDLSARTAERLGADFSPTFEEQRQVRATRQIRRAPGGDPGALGRRRALSPLYFTGKLTVCVVGSLPAVKLRV